MKQLVAKPKLIKSPRVVAGPAKAMVTRVLSIGINVGPGGATLLDMHVRALLLLDASVVYDVEVPVILDPTSTVAAMGVAVRDAVVAFAATFGIVIGAGRTLIPTFTRL